MIKERKTTIEVNGTKVEALIMITVHEDQDAYDALIDCDDQAEVMRAVDRGELFGATVFVNASAFGLEGVDSLTGVGLVPNNAFNSEPFENSVNECIDSNGMIENALGDLRAQLETRYTQLIEQAEIFKPFNKAVSK